MKFRIEEKKDDPLILNLFQTGEYNANRLMGKLIPEEELDVGENPTPAGDNRLQFQWRAIDAVTENQVDEKQRTTPTRNNIITIEAGEVSPRKIYILLPDKFTEISNELKRGFGDDGPKTMLGLVLAKFYRAGKVIEALEMVADNEPDIMEKLDFAVRNSELDDTVKETVHDLQKDQLRLAKEIESGGMDEI